ncbi:hypothetical protein QCA50_017509 [Cerrena zonata]|uniref:SET domain-containing protein n=1 Tax=Cerrena zonata TaxID=2478898 RepID=A0AAW0FD71_9APHY
MKTGISRKDHTTENNRTFTRLTDLLNWCSENNIILDPRIQLVDDPNFGISVFSKDIHIPAFETLVTIPKTAVLSSRSSSLIRLIPELEVIPYGHGAHLSLALCLYYELLLGPDSRWSGYLRSLPKEPVAIALFWDVQVHAICNSDNELEELWASPSSTDREKPGECTEFPVLKENPEDGALARRWSVGTEIDREQRTEDGVWLLDELQDYYRNTVLPVFRRLNKIRQFAEPGPSQQSSFSIPQDCHPTLRGYLHAYSLVSSRAFLVDAYHGLSMVPIADAFNHSIPNHVHLESEYDVCVICGSLSQCLHDTDGEGEDSSSSHLPTHSWPNIDPNDTCDMTSNLPIPPHVQIYNTYGENLTNAQLLVRYGFALPSGCNDNDVVSWKFHELPTVESLALPTPQDKRKSSVGDSYQRSGGPPQSALEFPGEPTGRSEDLGTVLQILLENVLRVWPSEARWKESELVFNPSHAHGSEVTNLPLSDSAVDEGGHAAEEDDEDVVLVEHEGGDNINIDVDIKTTVAASVTDRRREDFPESSTTEGYRHQYHRSWADFYDPDTDSGNDAIQTSTSMPSSVSVSILDAGRVHEKEEGNERHLHLASTRARGLSDHWNGNEDDDDDSEKDGDSRKQVYNGNEGNIGNSGSEKNEKSGESRNIDNIGNIAGISRDDAVAVDRDLDNER